MSLQKFEYCPRCGEKRYGRYCVRCGCDTEKEQEAIASEFSAGSELPFESEFSGSTELGVLSERVVDSDFTTEAEQGIDLELDFAKYAAGTEFGRTSERDPDFAPSERADAEFDPDAGSAPFSVREKEEASGKPNGIATEEFEIVAETVSPKVAAGLSESQYAIRLKKLTVCVQYLCVFFASVSLLLLLCPYRKSSVSSEESLYALTFFSKFPLLMIISNTALIFASFHLTKNRRFTSVVLCVLQLLSLIPISLLISESENIQFSFSVYAYLVLAVLGLALYLTYAALVFVLGKKILLNRHCAEPEIRSAATGTAARTARRVIKPKSNTKKIIFSVSACLVLVAVTGVSIFCGVYFSSIFRAEKVNQIEIGFYSAKVEQILGKPNYSSGVDEWVYYDDDYRDITQKINGPISSGDYKLLSTQRSAMFYRRISIKFSNKTVTSIEYDAKHVDANAHLYQYKPYKKIVLDPSEISYGRPVSVSASVYYDDGSFRKYALPKDALKNVDSFIKGRYIVSWSDNWNDYSATLEVK